MQILLGIIIACAAIVIWFFVDRSKKRNQIAAIGGMKAKYSVLVNEILAIPKTQIVRLGADFIIIEYDDGVHYFFYDITQHWTNVKIRFYQKTHLGIFDKTWTFNETMDQGLMLQQIRMDISKIL